MTKQNTTAECGQWGFAEGKREAMNAIKFMGVIVQSKASSHGEGHVFVRGELTRFILIPGAFRTLLCAKPKSFYGRNQ